MTSHIHGALGLAPEQRAPVRTEWLDTDRAETYSATLDDGTTVTVTHNIDTGETRSTR